MLVVAVGDLICIDQCSDSSYLLLVLNLDILRIIITASVIPSSAPHAQARMDGTAQPIPPAVPLVTKHHPISPHRTRTRSIRDYADSLSATCTVHCLSR